MPQCLMKCIDAVKPGVRFREIGEIISSHASKAGMGVVKSYCGHGIGDLFHCAPNIPHYARNKVRRRPSSFEITVSTILFLTVRGL
jgi:methionyl aminopeptidase